MTVESLLDKIPNSVNLSNEFTVEWTSTNIGFGLFKFYTKDDVIYCDNECMSKEFIKQILCDMVDNSVLTD
jgi:hypothetical protein